MAKQKKLPKLKPAEIQQNILAMSRSPFQHMLSELVENPPPPARLKQLAKESPHLWMQMVSQTARLAGYTDKVEVGGTVGHVHVAAMGDSQLDDEIQRLMNELKPPIEGEVEEDEQPKN